VFRKKYRRPLIYCVWDSPDSENFDWQAADAISKEARSSFPGKQLLSLAIWRPTFSVRVNSRVTLIILAYPHSQVTRTILL
jgi:hypothetical protein